MPRAPSPHCPVVKLKLSGFSFAFDIHALLPFLFPPPTETIHKSSLAVVESASPPALHTSVSFTHLHVLKFNTVIVEKLRSFWNSTRHPVRMHITFYA